MKFSHLKLIVLLCAFASSAKGQDGNLLFHHLKLDDGLSEQTNSYVYKDSKGFVWISSINGLNRFDGTRVKVYSPNPSDSTSIYGQNIQSNFFEDRSSALWFCTYEAINCYIPKQDAFSHFTLLDKYKNPMQGYHVFYQDSLANLWTIVEGNGIYTFNTSSKLFRFITPLKLSSSRAVVVESSPGRIRKIFAYKPSRPGIEEISFDTNHSLENNTILQVEKGEGIITPKRIVTEGDTVIWIASKTQLIKYYLKTNIFEHHYLEDILTIENLNDSTLLVSIDEKGVWEYDKILSRLVYQYMPENGNALSLLTNRVQYISRDIDGGFWMCSVGYGLSYSYPSKKKFTLHTPVSKTNANISKFNPNGFYEDTLGRVFCSTSKDGLYTLDRNCQITNQWFAENAYTDTRIHSIYSIFKDKNKNTWLSTYNGLSVIPAGSFKIRHITDHTQIMWNAVELKNGNLIFSASEGGLYILVTNDDKYSLTRIDSIRYSKEYLPICQDNHGMIWINEQLQKIIVLDPSSYKTIAEIPIDGITSNFIEKLEDHTAWISSTTGLYEVDTRDYRVKNVYNERNDLPCAGFNNMLVDKSGKLWLTCKNQIIVFNPATKYFKVFSEDDGLPHSQFIPHGACRFNDGEMWFASMGAITSFHPDKLGRLSIRAIPQITMLLVNDADPNPKLVCSKTQATNISEIEKLTFSYRENTLSFIINSLEYSAPKNNKVKYKMEGFDTDWVEASSGSIIRYPNLPSRTFTFHVIAANSDGEYSPYFRSLDITITPPFYKTWWFILLASLTLLGLVVYIVYLNFSKTIELQKVRLGLYENLHDDIGSRLTSIVFSAEELINEKNDRNPQLLHIAKVARSIVSNMRRLVWAIDPENDSMDSLLQKIRYDKTLILDDKIDFHIDVDHQLHQVMIPGEIRYQMISIINEALHNISKYAQAKNVWIHLSKSDSSLDLSIKDDGVGFNPNEVNIDKIRSTGYGLSNMQKRAARVKGVFAILSTPTKGTKIEVKIPLT